MKILLFTDVHWSRVASLVNKQATKYSTRLEGLLKSINWVNEVAIKNNCEAMICAGDFFDKTELDAESATALADISWNTLPLYLLCGNHEASTSDLKYNLLNLLKRPNTEVITDIKEIVFGNSQLHFIPYITEVNRKDLVTYLVNTDSSKKQVIISHNEIAGINYGAFKSTAGFSIEEIDKNVDLYLNGHLHNSEFITKKILNLGSLSAHNFTNDSSKYKYGVWILDTETLELKFLENPYAFNFYKFDILEAVDLNKLDKIKNQAVLSIRCAEDLIPDLKAKLASIKDKIAADKVNTIVKIAGDGSEVDISELVMDHIAKFCECCREKLEASDILEAELAEICK